MNTQQMHATCGQILQAVREKKPIVHQITNYVTVQDCANMVLALGGSPIMADEMEELFDIVQLSKALVLNIGTLNERTRASMLMAGRYAQQAGIPIILDPVGSGASRYRTETVQSLISAVMPTVIRGNLSEIRSVAQLASHTSGVDAAPVDDATGIEETQELAYSLARKLGCVVAITGKTDSVSDGTSIAAIGNGHQSLTRITGTGCMSSALVGTCCAVTDDFFGATVTALLCMGIAGELASVHTGLGVFHASLFDHISTIDGKCLMEKGNLYVR
ncbi:MAG: hydroxyethylthiazole kinase [Sphaerochaeta sp.]|uniref:hydroxyethylthiazole kinase n=1 Tax=Sphaerochaeta sp. TaxID=1972642 RepID=UPI00297BB538|nr:hydroxyethylthiazole kinase [Sphaerochaeta sp.]MDD3929279.1 hydroxyethylthiazole kinase [Sphaerochaeta sp.]